MFYNKEKNLYCKRFLSDHGACDTRDLWTADHQDRSADEWLTDFVTSRGVESGIDGLGYTHLAGCYLHSQLVDILVDECLQFIWFEKNPRSLFEFFAGELERTETMTYHIIYIDRQTSGLLFSSCRHSIRGMGQNIVRFFRYYPFDHYKSIVLWQMKNPTPYGVRFFSLYCLDD